ncbi:hypothetical protein GYMLUDRAFT_45928 [Collybiopsis luxurians FD-317 M1]|uniref:Uncharacterized protein n=1 Tax=Collybiopsis luxurians FD-317 M1 TaxID=944289 RepID=A0A0D0B3A8_9AGAR|nr:hypothetical protein GYMLUDRAFT_45928 [Collybiopsis luxurians FD-317 M1]
MSKEVLVSNYIEFVAGTVVPCTITTFFLYGLYSLLFCIYIQIQIRDSRSHRPGNRHRRPTFFRISLPALFLLISLDVILSTISLYEQLRSQTLLDLVSGKQSLTEPDAHYFRFCNFELAASVVFTVASTMADTVLLYRAYTLWDRKKTIVIPAVILLLSSFGMLKRCRKKILNWSAGSGVYAIILGGKGRTLLITDFLAGETMLKDAKIGILIFACSTLVTNLSLTGLIEFDNSVILQTGISLLPNISTTSHSSNSF